MKAEKFSEKININAAPELIFDYTQDYSNRLNWDTFLKRAELIAGATKADKGVKAYCVAKNGLGMETEYVSFNRPKVTAVKMTKGPFLFKTFLGSWTFKELTQNVTEVTFLYSFELRFSFTLFTFFVKRNLQNNVRQRLIDLKTCIERYSHNTHLNTTIDKEEVSEQFPNIATKDFVEAKISAVEAKISEAKFQIILWAFVFWVTQLAAMFAFLKFYIK